MLARIRASTEALRRGAASARCSCSTAPVRHFGSSDRVGSNKDEVDEATAKLTELMDKFRDPTSHYHISADRPGPSAEDDHSTSRAPAPSLQSDSSPRSTKDDTLPQASSSLTPGPRQESQYANARKDAEEWFRKEGYDLAGTLEWPVAWGESDMFQHVNNVHYVRWVESARIQYCKALNLPEEVVRNMLGMGFILKDVAIKYKRPITWPDHILIACRPYELNQSRAYFKLGHAIWSLKDNQLAALGDSTLVMYDYDALKKGTMSDEFSLAIEARLATTIPSKEDTSR